MEDGGDNAAQYWGVMDFIYEPPPCRHSKDNRLTPFSEHPKA